MKTPHFLACLCLGLAGLAWAGAAEPAKPAAPAAAGAAKPGATNAAPAEIVIPKSVFVDDITVGRDPFHPKSSRRSRVTTRPPVNNPANGETKPQPPPGPGPNDLMLQGFSGPFALINGVDIKLGSTETIKVKGDSLVVTYVERREGSVLVRIKGFAETFELKAKK